MKKQILIFLDNGKSRKYILKISLLIIKNISYLFSKGGKDISQDGKFFH